MDGLQVWCKPMWDKVGPYRVGSCFVIPIFKVTGVEPVLVDKSYIIVE